MKLTLNAEELLALHDLLRAHLGPCDDDVGLESFDDTELRRVFRRLRVYVLNAVADTKSKPIDPASLGEWLVAEQSKIDDLKKQNAANTSRLTELTELARATGTNKLRNVCTCISPHCECNRYKK